MGSWDLLSALFLFFFFPKLSVPMITGREYCCCTVPNLAADLSWRVFVASYPVVVAQIGHSCQASSRRHTDCNIWVAISWRMPLQITEEGHYQLVLMSWFTTELWPDAHTDKNFYCALRDIFSNVVSIWEPLSVWILLCSLIWLQTLRLVSSF